jgi:hypothetical protein
MRPCLFVLVSALGRQGQRGRMPGAGLAYWLAACGEECFAKKSPRPRRAARGSCNRLGPIHALGPIYVTAVADVDDGDDVSLVVDPVDDAVRTASCAEPVI